MSNFLAPLVAMTAARIDEARDDIDRSAVRSALDVLCQHYAEAGLVWSAALALRRLRRRGLHGWRSRDRAFQRPASCAAALAIATGTEGAWDLSPPRWIVPPMGRSIRAALDPRRLPGGALRPVVRPGWQRRGESPPAEVEA